MFICKYFGGKKFSLIGSDELIEIDTMLNNDIVNYSLEAGKTYLILQINKKLIVLPYKVSSIIEDNIEPNFNNYLIFKENGDVSIGDSIIIKNTGDIEITLQPLKKLKINNKNVLTNGAVITAPNGPCTITQDGQ